MAAKKEAEMEVEEEKAEELTKASAKINRWSPDSQPIIYLKYLEK